MRTKHCGLFVVAAALLAAAGGDHNEDNYDDLYETTTRSSDFCPKPFVPPTECFPIEEIKDYGLTAASMESLYNQYINLLTEAQLTIDGDEVRISD